MFYLLSCTLKERIQGKKDARIQGKYFDIGKSLVWPKRQSWKLGYPESRKCSAYLSIKAALPSGSIVQTYVGAGRLVCLRYIQHVLEVAAVLSWGGEPFLLPEGKAEASSICVSSDLDHVGKWPKSWETGAAISPMSPLLSTHSPLHNTFQTSPCHFPTPRLAASAQQSRCSDPPQLLCQLT